ncbi:serine/threonine-protein kinase [Cellulomonas alba]|uniref:non-specific serine/threonine protein kinase n=1 Tax=Cellulomonas alba TaxID=3053467 RepID=A0ABT7SD18_9CELL|nr:serine/threonine-protein kinase [Cellulomonas alba]MDM7854078.1 serine/threonine-protein kinase [Cellulomonas alba]
MPLRPSSDLAGVELVRRYRLASPLGQGGSGEVYRATDSRLGREVAIKVFALGTASQSEIRQYAAEARVLAGLSHPGLVALLDVGADTLREAGPVAFLVTELVDGRTLRDTLADGPLEPGLVADVGLQLARALDHAHGAGVVHRDVKPSNVLVAPDRASGGGSEAPWLPVVLADFGIARAATPGAGSEQLTSGTAGYISPEQALGEQVGPSADVYSLGLVLLECLTGERAYPGDPLASSLARLLSPVSVPERFGADWVRLLTAMTTTESDGRPPMPAVIAELRALRRASTR